MEGCLLLFDSKVITKNDLLLAGDQTSGIPILYFAEVLTLCSAEAGRRIRLPGTSVFLCRPSTRRGSLGDSTAGDVTIANSSVCSPNLALPLIVR